MIDCEALLVSFSPLVDIDTFRQRSRSRLFGVSCERKKTSPIEPASDKIKFVITSFRFLSRSSGADRNISIEVSGAESTVKIINITNGRRRATKAVSVSIWPHAIGAAAERTFSVRQGKLIKHKATVECN